MKLEVGMYIRTKEGGIAKIEEIKPDDIHKTVWCYLDRAVDLKCFYIKKETVSKASNNIIDLIEVGDILEINNEKYEVIYDESYEKLGILIPSRKELSIRHSALEYVFKKYKVSIVTKEQFESTQYKIN